MLTQRVNIRSRQILSQPTFNLNASLRWNGFSQDRLAFVNLQSVPWKGVESLTERRNVSKRRNYASADVKFSYRWDTSKQRFLSNIFKFLQVFFKFYKFLSFYKFF